MKNWLSSKTIWLNAVLIAVGAYATYTGMDITAMLTVGAALANIMLRFKTTEGVTLAKVIEAVEDVQDLFDGDEEKK